MRERHDPTCLVCQLCTQATEKFKLINPASPKRKLLYNARVSPPATLIKRFSAPTLNNANVFSTIQGFQTRQSSFGLTRAENPISVMKGQTIPHKLGNAQILSKLLACTYRWNNQEADDSFARKVSRILRHVKTY